MLKRNDVLPSSSSSTTRTRAVQNRFAQNRPRAFAEVYSAVDLTGGSDGPAKSGRRCAIKIESEMKTTKREATAMRHLAGGKGIVEIYDEGVFWEKKFGKEHPFIAMQLVGENLADLKRDVESSSPHHRASANGTGTSENNTTKRANNLFTEITIARIAAQTIDALGYMHVKGYVHRDVKPGTYA